ncbi:MAG: cupin protein [Flaviaesturariibacter sp.]|nr:cupin protein [Flaviaesturariibacter sp.]
MAYPGKEIVNPVIGQQIRFLKTADETCGQLLEMEATYRSRSREPKPHYHPQQEEYFMVMDGQLNVRLNGTVRKLRRGDRLLIPRNTVHSMWNEQDEKAVVIWQVRPALQTEYMLETAAGLASDGKTDGAGMPTLLQRVLLARRFTSVFRLASPSFLWQRILFALLAPVSYLAGYRPVYRQYLD